MAIAHKVLGDMMARDPTPGMREVLALLYPNKEKRASASVSPTSSSTEEELANNINIDSSIKEVKGVVTEDVKTDNMSPRVTPTRGRGRGRGRGRKVGSSASVTVTNTAHVPTAEEEAVDDPSNEPDTTDSVNANPDSRTEVPKYEDCLEEDLPVPQVDKVHTCLICHGKNDQGGKVKEACNLNLGDKLTEVKYHYAVCYYAEGKFRDLIDAGPNNRGEVGDHAEDVGSQFKYRCPFEGCAKTGSGRGGSRSLMGYKAYVIHAAVVHHQLEVVMKQDARPGMDEVRAAIILARRQEGGVFEPMPPVQCEEVHQCQLCLGEGDGKKEGKSLSFNPEKILSLRYHYASCYYDTGIYFEKYPLAPENMDKDGKPIDHLGRDFKYICAEKKCSNRKRKMGYKEWCIHQASDHGGLIEIMSQSDNEEIRKVGKRLESFCQVNY